MNAQKPAVPSPAAIARAGRKRLAAEEGVRAIADVERQAIEVRKNMARLRELREAKEAAEGLADEALLATQPAPKAKKRTRKSGR